MQAVQSFAATSVAVLTLLCCARAADYYVDGLRGQDVASAGSQSAPWKSLGYALSRVPTPPANSTHRVFVVGGQDYVVDSTIVLRDRVVVVGLSASKPRFVAGRAAQVFGVDASRADARFELRSVAVSGGERAVALGPQAQRQSCALQGCVFTSQSKASVSVDLQGGSCQLELDACSALGVETAVAVTARASSSARLELSRCAFERSTLDAVLLTTHGSAQLAASLRESRFALCNRGVSLDHDADMIAIVEVDACAFRRGSFGAVEARVEGPALLRVTDCTILRNDSGVLVHSRARGPLCVLRLERNHVASNAYYGLQVLLDPPLSGSACPWDIVTRDNHWERCEENYRVRVASGVAGQWTAEREQSRESNGYSMNFALGSPSFSARVENSVLVRAARVGLGVSGPGAFRGRFLTIADHAGRHAIDTSGASDVELDHCVLDNSYTPELRVGSGFKMTWSCVRSELVPGVGNIKSDPMLLRPQFQLAAASPCIDAGDPLAILTSGDFERDARRVRTSRDVVDMGADEYRASGSTRAFGTPGFGLRDGLRPVIDGAGDDARIGSSLVLAVKGAVDAQQRAAPAALLVLGVGEGPPVLDLDASACFGCLLYSRPLFFSSPLALDAAGAGRLTLVIPAQSSLVGAGVGGQWLVLSPPSNELGLVTSDAYRIRVGR